MGRTRPLFMSASSVIEAKGVFSKMIDSSFDHFSSILIVEVRVSIEIARIMKHAHIVKRPPPQLD